VIIDAHNHPDWWGHDLEKTMANMEQYKIDVAWLLTCESPPDEYAPSYIRVMSPVRRNGDAISFERCLSYAERAPGKFVLGYAPDPRRPYAVDRLEAAIDIHGVQVYGELKLRMMYDNLDAIRMFRVCGRRGLPVVAHIGVEETSQSLGRGDYWYGGGIEAFERAVRACPDTIFLGHASGFWTHISGDGSRYEKEPYPTGKVTPGGKVVKMLREYENLYGDLSAQSGYNALHRDTDFAREFLLEFQDRLLYARDYFDNVHQELLNTLDLPKDVLDKIYYKNALRLVPLKK